MNCELAQKKCIPCEGGIEPLRGQTLTEYLQFIDKHWTIAGEHHLVREFQFSDFRESLAFTNKVGEISEEEGHHPDILLSYGKVVITLWTHAIDGLSENDFILAAKIDQL